MNVNQKKYALIENYALFLTDILCIPVAYYIGFNLRFANGGSLHGIFDDLNLWVFLMSLAFSLFFHLAANASRDFFSRGYLKELILSIERSVIFFSVIAALLFAFHVGSDFSRLFLGYFVAVDFVISYFARIIVKKLCKSQFHEGAKGDSVLLVTSFKRAEHLAKHIKKDKGWSYHVCGLAITDKTLEECKALAKEENLKESINQGESGDTYLGYKILADKTGVLDYIRENVVDVVVLYRTDLSRDDLWEIVTATQNMGITCHVASNLPDDKDYQVTSSRFAGIPVFSYYTISYDYRKRVIKRLTDILGSIVGLVITGILFIPIALAIKLDSKGPVIFSQYRMGKNGRKFKIYKFRTMCNDAESKKKELEAQNEMDGAIFKIEHDPRITKVGAFLRKTSLDELPQFYNILRADMSLVGTRPPTLDEYEKYSDEARRRMSIRPGLTGLWQVSGRSDIKEFSDIVKLDLEYIDNWSLSLDFKLLVMTVFKVLKRDGAK